MDTPEVPKHVAFIMDGNRRWARAKGLPIMLGHKKGIERITDVVKHAHKLGIHHVTFWAFSTENWKRNAEEIDGLMNAFRNVFNRAFLNDVAKEGAKIIAFGDLSRFPEDIQKNVREVIEETKNHTGIIVNIALNYGGRAEILYAVNQLLQQHANTITEEAFSNLLYSKSQPDPDLIIRSGGEKRLSGYMPWQSVYSEIYFTDTYWPDFDAQALDTAIEDFYGRQRRFGK